MITFKYINNTNGGFYEIAQVAKDTTIHDFLSTRHPDTNFENYRIRFTRLGNKPIIASGQEVITNNSRLTVTPNKVNC